MSDIILKVENVSKQYQLGTFGTKTIGGDVHRWWITKVLGKEDPFLKVGEVNDRTSKEKADFVWALKDINFEVKRGEVLGIIGKNGAGKSTLLKLLSRVTSPTSGTIKSAGRMASLLEVGTGFHPELTGLENIYLNGAILGMTKSEIKRKLEEIIDFSGCALYIDTPVKRYSSGMKVRLGFAVAAFLDPEILVVDEVLAVGDAEFQKKAIGKMQDVSSEEGRTILFVSHNMDAVSKLCTRLLLLENGTNIFDGDVQVGLSRYTEEDKEIFKVNHPNLLGFYKRNISLDSVLFNVNSNIHTGQKLQIELQLTNKSNASLQKIRLSLGFSEDDKIKFLVDSSMCGELIKLESQECRKISFDIDSFPLGEGLYDFIIYIESEFGEEIAYKENRIHCVSNQIFGNDTKLRQEWPKNIVYTPFKINQYEYEHKNKQSFN